MFIDAEQLDYKDYTNDMDYSYHTNVFTGAGHREGHWLADAKTAMRGRCDTGASGDSCSSLLASRTCIQNRYDSVATWSTAKMSQRRVRSRELEAAKYYLDRVKGWYNSGQCDAVLTTTTPGCMDAGADNYNPNADQDDGSCIFPTAVVYGCTDSGATNYDSNATNGDGSCQYAPQQTTIYGCMDPSANNFDSMATIDNASCKFTMPDNIFTPPINNGTGTGTDTTIDRDIDLGDSWIETDNNRMYLIGGVLALTLGIIILNK